MKFTYLLDIKKIREELSDLWNKYQKILNDKNSNWKELTEARAILYLTGNIYCEQIAVDAIKKRLPLLKQPLQLS